MSRRRRCIKSKTTYEICFRARRSLPLSAHRLMKRLIESAIARTQRDDKVILCHDIWNGSHTHLIVKALDAEQCKNFYMEIQKKITDAVKRLLKVDHLEIWEGRPTVVELPNVDAVIVRIAYLYANPAQDDLEESIDRFPGLSSWRPFLNCLHTLDAKSEEIVPWIRLPSIQPLDSRHLSDSQDINLTRQLEKLNRKKSHKLIRRPNAWMKCFEIESDEEAKAINERIVQEVRVREEEERLRRKLAKKTVMGSARLLRQPIMKEHQPKKRERKIFVYSTIKEIRLDRIAAADHFEREYDRCSKEWRGGNLFVEWPPGAFRPPIPPLYNVLPYPADWVSP